MVPFSLKGAYSEPGSQVLWEDGERVFRRGWRLDGAGERRATLFVVPAAEHPSGTSLDHLRHEYELKDELDAAWAVRPLELLREAGRTVLVLEDPGGEPLEPLLCAPMETGRFLRLAIAMAVALGNLHQRGLVHKDIKPVHILANDATGAVHLTGFGIASRLARERQSPHPAETLAGTLAYMAPEQTGRMNRSVDSRSDLYALGVVLYQMLTGALPFAAAEPMEWVHCHLARRAVPPAERHKEVPAALSAIVMKLLAKRAEDRYQTAAGLECDLRHCQAEWESQHRIDEFPLGERDASDRLLVPEKLYGRERELATLISAFDRVIKGGAPELVLVSGYSGIGKSSVVNELQPVLVPARCLFVSGKFDQYKRDIPYSTLAQAFQHLIRSLLGKSETDLAPWREALQETLGPNAGLMADLVPELKLIIGEPPPVPELPPQDARRRFQLVFHRFLAVFARSEHPLALFLDDLQWVDAATLDLLEDLLTRSELRHLLLIAAYRDNEVNAAHPLMRKLEAIRSSRGKIDAITLGPLAREHLEQWLADTLRCEPTRSAPLAQIVQEKTGGNPFFTVQFIHSLAEEGMLTFDYDAISWSWDLDRIHAKGYTDNVVDLMVEKLSRLPAATQVVLQHLACLGSLAAITTLTTALEISQEELHAALWESVRQGLVDRLDGACKFIHDRVQEAAYSLIPEASRAEAHLRIGRLLAARGSPGKPEDTVFDVVHQLNRGVALITSRDERENLAELNLIAARRAKGSAAYASALKYLIAGAALLDDDCWQRRRDLMFALELARAECESLTGELTAADERSTALASHAVNADERAALAFLHMGICMELVQSDRAVAVALDYLRHVGIEISPHPTEDEMRREYEQIWLQLGSRAIEQVVELPLMRDPEALAAVEVLTGMMTPATLTDPNLLCLTLCRAVNLSLELGNCEASCLAYVMLGSVVIQRFRDYKTALRFGQTGFELAERRGLRRFEAGTCHYFGASITPWTKHVRASVELLRRASDAADKVGDLTYSGYATCCLHASLLVSGETLSSVQRGAELFLDSAEKAGFRHHIDQISSPLALIRTLRGLTPRFGSFDCQEMQELPFERHLASNPYLAVQECFYWIRKLQARYFAGDYQEAMEASSKAQRLLWISPPLLEQAEYHFYSALSYAASCDSATAEQLGQHLEVLTAHHRQLGLWSEHCPENFENRVALIGAEIARIEHRDLDAMHLYQKAIHSSRASGFVHNEALAYERASSFYRARGFDQFADTYLRSARACYAAWGADGKVQQLDRLYPGIKPDQPVRGPASTITTPLEGLDLATVIRASQAVSSEIVLEKLLDILMRTATELAGAERGLLVIPHGGELRIEAESKTNGTDVAVQLKENSAAATALPEPILRYVMRTHETVILDDALSGNPFSAEAYVLEHQIRSVLCLPLINQTKLTGILYLENNLAPRVFSPGRVATLKVLASQAAISIQNTMLYRSLEEREARIRRLFDINVIGLYMTDVTGRIVESNDAFLRMIGYDREDLVSGALNWIVLTPPEWRDHNIPRREQLNLTGSAEVFEKEYSRRDGRRVPVLVGGARIKDGSDEVLVFVLDLTERKRSEQTLRQLESDLAHVNRVSMLGELMASLAHEVRQPIGAARNNARAALNFMAMQPPDLGEIREAVACIVGDVDRAGEIIDRVGEQIKKAPLRKARCDLNEAIKEVIGLARSITMSNGVSVGTRLADGALPIRGDRIQLQQVVLNLILNAVEAMGSTEADKREVLISTEQTHTGILVAVRDFGPGIDPAHLERVFESFYTTKPGGTGMGLSVCRSIIDAHGGRLWAGANDPHGAVFQFTLPGAEDDASTSGASPGRKSRVKAQ